MAAEMTGRSGGTGGGRPDACTALLRVPGSPPSLAGSFPGASRHLPSGRGQAQTARPPWPSGLKEPPSGTASEPWLTLLSTLHSGSRRSGDNPGQQG